MNPMPTPPARVRWAARVILAVWLAYPVVFYTWFLAADRVTATLKPCPYANCYADGTWTMADGTAGSGEVVGGRPDYSSPSTVTVRATRSWAVVDSPIGSLPADLADFAAIGAVGAAFVGFRIERRVRRRYGGD